MQGQVINFDSRMASGTLRCNEGKQYNFSEREWQGVSAPQPGDRVTFMPIGLHATGVAPMHQAAAAASAPAKPATPTAQAPTAAATAPTLSSLAVISLVAGVAGLFFFGSLIAVICGHIARSQIRRSQGQLTCDGLAIAGLILGYFALVVTLLITIGLVGALLATT